MYPVAWTVRNCSEPCVLEKVPAVADDFKSKANKSHKKLILRPWNKGWRYVKICKNTENHIFYAKNIYTLGRYHEALLGLKALKFNIALWSSGLSLAHGEKWKNDATVCYLLPKHTYLFLASLEKFFHRTRNGNLLKLSAGWPEINHDPHRNLVKLPSPIFMDFLGASRNTYLWNFRALKTLGTWNLKTEDLGGWQLKYFDVFTPGVS